MIESTADVPILAFKRCNLAWSPGGRFRLMSGYTGEMISVDADARCASHMQGVPSYMYSHLSTAELAMTRYHESPGVECRCGFYAVKDEDAAVGYGLVLLDVELSGRVIVHERGYRAQHQRVLRGRFTGCHFCGEPVDAIAIVEATPFRALGIGPVCEMHHNHADATVTLETFAKRLELPFDLQASEHG